MSRRFYRSELLGASPVHLLTLHYAARTLRLSSEPADVVDAAGTVHAFEGGLEAPSLEESYEILSQEPAAAGVSLRAVLPVDIASLESNGYDFAAATGELALWLPGSALEDRQILIRGRIVQPSYGAEGEPVEFGLESTPYDDRALLPDAAALVTENSWPDAHEGALGSYYPEVVGAPGRYIGTDGTAYTVAGSPALIIDWSGSQVDRLLIAGHRVAASSVTVIDPEGATTAVNVTHTTDGAGRTVALVDLSAAATVDRTLTGQWWIGWHNGGGRRRADESQAMVGAGEILAYYLSRATVTVDAGRVAAAAAPLNQFRPSFYVDAPISPLALLQQYVLPMLPAALVAGPDGLYPLVWRYWATRSDAVEHIDADRPGLSRVGPVSRQRDWRQVANELRVEWAQDRAGSGPRRVTVLRASPASGEYTSRAVQHSARRHGHSARVVVAETCDAATAARVADWMARAYAGIPRMVTYQCPPEYGWLELGALVTLSDSDLSFDEEVGIVSGRAWVSTGIHLTLTLLADPGLGEWDAA